MVSFAPAPGEKVIIDEDCAEDKLRSGILVLTDKRLVFQKTQGRMATLSKKEGEVVLDIPLGKITGVKSEGFLVKKVVVVSDDQTYKFGVYSNGKVVVVSDDQTYKFGVYSNGKWERQIKQLIGAS